MESNLLHGKVCGKKVMYLFAVFFCIVFTMQKAEGQVTGPIQADEIRQAAERPGDRSRDGLEMVFGGIVNDPLAVSGGSSGGSGQQTLVSNVFKVLNGLGLIVGIFVIGFVVFRKIFQAGNDGEIFKRGGENSFAVLKVVWGFIGLVPTASGWSMAQLAVLWSASLIGVGTANLATDSTLSAFYEGQTMALEPAMPETTSLAESLFNANLCSIGINKGIQEAQASGANLGSASIIESHTIPNTGFILADASRSKVCGGATYPEQRERFSSYLGFGINPSEYRQAQIEALQQMQSYLKSRTEEYANAVFARKNDPNVAVPSASLIIDSAARTYDQALGSMANLADNKSDEIRDSVVNSIEDKGWWELGAWYNSIAQANSVVTDNMLNRARAVGQTINMQGAVSSYYNQLMASTQVNRQQVGQVSASDNTATKSPNTGSANQQISNDTNQLVNKVFGFFSGEKWASALVGLSESDNGVVNPMIAMKNLGDWVLVGGEASFVSYVALRGAVGFADEANDSIWGNVLSFFSGGMSGGVVGAISQIIEAISPFLVLGIIVIFGLGLTLSIYVPFIPFIIWFAAIINWVIFVAIGVVAAPLWAFSHLTGDEGGGMSKTQHGYIFMVNAMLRPVLMVAAFFIAGGIIIMGGTLLNQLFTPAIQNVQSDSITGLASIIAIISVYVSICLTLLHTCFNLIFQIPDKVMEWIGGSEIATGQGSEQEQRNALQNLASYVRDAGGRPGSGPSDIPSGGGGKNSIQKR
ncbi:DotA/TraY family protein [Halomonas elongata]|uniref:DotA/TraY family protein n=1 Tax=Halomonas elongata TaxID=2746 RepID=UPI00255A780D|nr:DotA/TraY family protein [Halomonas elongata]MDL4860710.1 DotA/TraY family protein [Halomonas elongata]